MLAANVDITMSDQCLLVLLSSASECSVQSHWYLFVFNRDNELKQVNPLRTTQCPLQCAVAYVRLTPLHEVY